MTIRDEAERYAKTPRMNVGTVRDRIAEAFEAGGDYASRVARSLCAACPIQAMCLDWALSHGEAFGIWGGTTASERRSMPGWTPRRDSEPCGTPAAYARHHRNGEQPCAACIAAHSRYRSELGAAS